MRFLYAIVEKQDSTRRDAWPRLVAAADAIAEGPSWGIGGWLLCPSDKLAAGNIGWFSATEGNRSSWFRSGPTDLQSCIAALEALAQLVLQRQQQQHFGIDSTTRWVSLRQWCDNLGVVGYSLIGLRC